MLGETIKQMREKQGLSQAALAYLAGVSRQAIINIETGRAMPRFDTLVSILKHLNAQVLIHETADQGNTGHADTPDRGGECPVASKLEVGDAA